MRLPPVPTGSGEGPETPWGATNGLLPRPALRSGHPLPGGCSHPADAHIPQAGGGRRQVAAAASAATVAGLTPTPSPAARTGGPQGPKSRQGEGEEGAGRRPEGVRRSSGRGACLALLLVIVLLSLPLAVGAQDWTLAFEDNFERAELGPDWSAMGLTRVDGGTLLMGREGDIGSSYAVCTREFKGALRLEYDAMSPVDTPCDLSAVLNGDEGGYSSGFFFGFGSQNNTTGLLLLKNQPGAEYPAIITPGKWHHVVAERDGVRFRQIIDGRVVLDYTHPGPLPGPLYPHVGFAVWHLGRFDNVRVFTKPEQVAVAQAPTPPAPGAELRVTARAYPAPGKIGVSVEVPSRAGLVAPLQVVASLRGQPAGAIASLGRVTQPGMREELIFDAADLPAGEYEATAVLTRADNSALAQASAAVNWPGRDPRFADVKALNNLVWELLDESAAAPGDLHRTHRFRLPIDRWLYVRTTAQVGEGSLAVMLDGEDPAQAIIVHDGAQRVMFAKRRATEGEHTLTVRAQGDAQLLRLEVRAICDIQHSRYPTQRWLQSNPEYDWEFISRCILPSATTIITSGDPEAIRDHIEDWVARGGRWISYTSRPGLSGNREVEQDADALFANFTARTGFTHPLMEGVLVDEFYTYEDPAYPTYIEMAKRIAQDPTLAGKSFNPYVAGRFGDDEGSIEFARWCIATGGMICREAYIAEFPTLAEGLNGLRRGAARMVDATENALPGATMHTVWVPGVFSFPWLWADGYPSVNYNAYLDMQFQYIATHPAFFGLGGMHIWRTGYTDEERVRWVGRFFAHYGIEGNTHRVTADPYMLTHIANPDFTEGLSGWTVDAASEGSIEASSYKGYGSLQGRHYRGNDTFALLRRSAERPNVLSQTIGGLQAGRLYSVKLFSADYGELQAGRSSKTVHPMSVVIEGGELIEGTKYQYQEAFPSRARIGEFTPENPLYLNLHWHVFRATGTTATLRISDWRAPNDPGGPADQALMVNFVEVKPFLPD